MVGVDHPKGAYYHEENYSPQDVKSQKTVKGARQKRGPKTNVAMQNNYLPNGTGSIMEDMNNQLFIDP